MRGGWKRGRGERRGRGEGRRREERGGREGEEEDVIISSFLKSERLQSHTD